MPKSNHSPWQCQIKRMLIHIAGTIAHTLLCGAVYMYVSPSLYRIWRGEEDIQNNCTYYVYMKMLCVYHLCASLLMIAVPSSSLANNSIGDKGMEALCAASSHFSSLTNLQ